MNISRRVQSAFARQQISQLASFGIAGILAGVGDYATMIVLHVALALSPVPSALFGYAVGTLISYFFNKMRTFSSSRSHREAAWRFIAVAGCGFVLTGILMHLSVDILHAQYLLARFVIVGMIAVLNFGCHKYWTFAHSN